jgi:hypothetical protein
LSQLNKIYKNDEKFKNTDDNFEFKLKIFINKCKRVELSSHAYLKEIAFMFANRALFHFYVNEYENITFDKFRVDMKRFFEEFEWKRFNLTKWQFIHIDNVIVANSNLSLIECFQKLCIDLNDIQKKLNFDYHDSSYMRKILIRACRDHSILLIELHNSSSNVSSLINSFYINIINFESINKKKILICKTSTQTSTNAITLIVRTSIISSIDDIVVNRSIIVTIVNSWLTFVFAINSRFVFLNSALYVINQIADQLITRKKNAKTRKSVLRIVI